MFGFAQNKVIYSNINASIVNEQRSRQIKTKITNLAMDINEFT